MKITRIYNQKTKGGINFEVDHEFLFSFKNKNSLVDSGFYLGQEITLPEIKEGLLIDIYNSLKAYAVEKALMRHKSSQQIRSKLKQRADKYLKTIKAEIKIFDNEIKEILDTIFEFLEEKGYINDLKSADNFVQGRIKHKPRGKHLLKKELFKKGYSKKDINKVINQIPENIQIENGIKLAYKKRRLLRNVSKNEEKQKIYRYLARKGFSSDIIRKVLDHIM